MNDGVYEHETPLLRIVRIISHAAFIVGVMIFVGEALSPFRFWQGIAGVFFAGIAAFYVYDVTLRWATAKTTEACSNLWSDPDGE